MRVFHYTGLFIILFFTVFHIIAIAQEYLTMALSRKYLVSTDFNVLGKE